MWKGGSINSCKSVTCIDKIEISTLYGSSRILTPKLSLLNKYSEPAHKCQNEVKIKQISLKKKHMLSGEAMFKRSLSRGLMRKH